MIPDWILASILGSVLTLVASLAILLITNYTNMKQKDKDRVIEETQNVIGNVYSPLLFHLFEISDYLSTLNVIFETFSQFDASKESEDLMVKPSEISKHILVSKLTKASNDLMISKFREVIERFKANSIRELLVTNLGFIRPSQFRVELFLYFQILNTFENIVKKFTINEDFDDDFAKDKQWFKNMNEVASRLSEINVDFIAYTNTLMHQRDKGNLNPEYKSLYSMEASEKMRQMIYSKTVHTKT